MRQSFVIQLINHYKLEGLIKLGRKLETSRAAIMLRPPLPLRVGPLGWDRAARSFCKVLASFQHTSTRNTGT